MVSATFLLGQARPVTVSVTAGRALVHVLRRQAGPPLVSAARRVVPLEVEVVEHRRECLDLIGSIFRVYERP